MQESTEVRRARLRARAAHPSTDAATRLRIERALERIEDPAAVRPAA